MLNLDLRPAKIGNQIRSNGQMNGDDTVTAFYIPLHGLMLTREEVNVLAADASWWSRHFDEAPGKPAEVLDHENFDTSISFKHKLDAGKVRFVHSLANEEVAFTACKLSKIHLQPRTGGLTELSFEVQTVPTLDETTARFLGQLNHEVQVEILAAEKSAKDRQTEMAFAPGAAVAAAAARSDEEKEADGQRQLEQAAQGLERQQQDAA